MRLVFVIAFGIGLFGFGLAEISTARAGGDAAPVSESPTPPLPTPESPKSELPTIVGVRVGFADCYKAGLWTPVAVTLLGGNEPIEGEVSLIVSDGDGVPTRVTTPPETPCCLSPGQETTVQLLTRFGRVNSDLTVEFRGKEDVLARRTFNASPYADREHFLHAVESRRLLVVIGATSLGAEDSGDRGVAAEDRPVVARLDGVEQLPLSWNAYEGIDAVLLSTSRPTTYEASEDVVRRLQVLDQWIRMGGRLVLSVGQHAADVLSESSPLRQFAPGRFETTKPLKYTDTSALESYCGGGPLPRIAGSDAAPQAAKLLDVHGVVEARAADVPLVIRSARGLGQVMFVAVDLDHPTLSHWSDRPMFIAKLLDMPTGRSDELNEGNAMMHFGFNDLAGQLRSALDQFDGIATVPFSIVAGLIIVYILLIGPGDYFFLRKTTRRMTWTWLTFPTIVVLVSVGSYYLTRHLKGDQNRLNQVDLIDVDASSHFVRGTTWANVFSPNLAAFNLSIQPNLPGGPPTDAQVMLSWFGLPGNALGGMSAQAGSIINQWTQPYYFAKQLDAIFDVPIQVGSTKSLTGRWIASTDVFPKVELTDENELLSGSVTNTLNIPLEQCILAYGRSVYDLGAIAPRETVKVDAMSKRSELTTLLVGRKFVQVKSSADKYRQETTPYDQSNTDLAYVLRMMMFHDAAGGRRYTGLLNDYQGFVDLSLLLKADRAILVAQDSAGGMDARRGVQLLNNKERLEQPQDKHVTIYRFVFPVKKGKSG